MKLDWPTREQTDYYNYLARRHLAGANHAPRLKMQQVTESLASLNFKEELSVEVLTKKRKLCELLYLPPEQVVIGR